MAASLFVSPHKNKGIFLETRQAGLYNSNKYLMLGHLLQDICPAKTPDGALALFEIFAGHISCNKRSHNWYLLLQ